MTRPWPSGALVGACVAVVLSLQAGPAASGNLAAASAAFRRDAQTPAVNRAELADYLAGVVVVAAQPDQLPLVESEIGTVGYRVASRVPQLALMRVSVPPGGELVAQSELSSLPGVAWTDLPHLVRDSAVVPNDTYYASYQYDLSRIGLESVWAVTTGDPSVVVAVLDTGVDFHHPDLAPNLLQGYDFVNDDDDPSDDSSHGTAVAGVIGAIGNNNVGVAGVAWHVMILPVKVLDGLGQGSDDIVAQGIVYAADEGARIINISSSTARESRVLREAVTYADEKGVLIVAAAGNTGDRDNQPNYPAAYDEVVAVAASDKGDKVPLFSQRQPYIGIAAPGVDIPSTAWDGAGLGPYALTTGTSAAAPHVSGVAALLLSIRPDLSNGQLKQVLQDAAEDVCPAGRDNASGFGRLDAAKALAAISSTSVPTSATPAPSGGATPAATLPGLPTLPGLAPAPASTPEPEPSPTPETLDSKPTSWYFAEGSTHAPFETWLTLFNPGGEPSNVKVTYMSSSGDSLVQEIRLPPDCRQSIRVNDVVPNAELALRVESSDTIFAERSMYFGHDGTDSIGASEPSRTWYLAEGSSAPPFDTWILVQNPTRRPASVTLTFMREDGTTFVQALAVDPTSRKSVYVNQLFQAAGFSTTVESDVPVVVERAMYFDGGQAGHGTIAVPSPQKTWYMAEGQTRGGFDTWLLIQNPNARQTSVDVTFFLEDGAPIKRTFQIAARARFSLYTNSILPSTTFGMKVEGDQPVVVERAVYFAQGRGGFDSAAVGDPAEEWFLAEGSTSGSTRETLALLNPNARSVSAMVRLTRGDGAPDLTHQVLLAPLSRTTVDVNRIVENADVSAHVTADRPIVVERTSIFAGGLGGTNAPGVPGER